MPGTRASARLRSGVQEAESPSESTSRAQVAAARRRVTRQTSPKTAATETEPPSSLPKQLRVQSPSHRGSNIARRSARRPMDSRSVASIPTVLQESSERAQTTEGEDNGDGSEDEADEDAIVAQLEIHSSGSEEPPASDQHTPNADMMVKSRQYLYDAARDMYEHLCLEDRDSTWDDLLWTLREVLNSWKIHYPTEKTPFLGRDLIDHTLKDHRKQVPVSHIVSAANLVILLDFVYQVKAGEGAPLRLFEKIDEDFPRCIMASESATAKTNEKHETFKLALRVRVSLWALRILETEDCTPEVAMNYGARLMFGQPGDYTAFPAEEDIKDIKFRSIHGVEFDNPSDDKETGMRKDIWRDFDLVRQIILSDDGFDPEAIKQAFPIDVCLDKLTQWAKSCFDEIVKTIDGEDESPRSRTSRRQANGIDGKT